MDTLFLNEQRCQCGKLLLKGLFFDGTLEIKCKKCGTINKIGSIKLADDATHYLLMFNDKGEITMVSNSACAILGYPCDELIGKHYSDISPSLSKETGEKFFGPDSILSEDNYFQLDTVHQTKDGKNIPITALLKLYHLNEHDRHVLLSSELKNVTNDAKISEKNNSEYLNNICDFYFDIDKSGIVEHISPSAEKFTGISQDTSIGKKYFDFISLKNREEAKNIFDNFSINGQPYRIINKTFINTEGKDIGFEMYFAPKYNDIGKFFGYCVLVWLEKK